MGTRRAAQRLLPWLSALVFAGCAASRVPADERADALTEHPVVKNALDTCQTCHSGSHPEVVDAWTQGAHGLNLVQCFVCHGSTEENFISRPEARRCDGCHAEQLASVTSARGTPQSCFSCHDPHQLSTEKKTNPHQGGGVRGAQR